MQPKTRTSAVTPRAYVHGSVRWYARATWFHAHVTTCCLPLQLAAEHTVQPSGFEFVELAGDEAAIKEWIGEGADTLPLRFASGPPALKSVGIKTADGLVTLT